MGWIGIRAGIKRVIGNPQGWIPLESDGPRVNPRIAGRELRLRRRRLHPGHIVRSCRGDRVAIVEADSLD